jgi:hypothetical protein
MNHSEFIAKLAGALSKAQGQIKGAKKDSVNPHFKAAYADLESTWEACRELLSKNGLSVIQFPYSRDGRTGIETMLLHDSGEWIRGEIDVRMTLDTNPQVAGSIITYLRRYSLQGAVGIAPADDDANAASPKPAQKTPDVAPQSTQTPTVTIGAVQIPLVPPAPVHKEAESSSEQNDARDELALVCSKIADIMGMDAGTVLYQLSVNKKGMYGVRSPNDIQWEANGPKGIWYPLKSTLSKAKKQLEELQKPTDDDVIPEDDIKY